MRTMRTHGRFAVVVAVLVLAVLPLAADFEAGMNYYKAGKYLEAHDPGLLPALERSVQLARGGPANDMPPAKHFARIGEAIKKGAFGEHTEYLRRFFEN